MEMVKFDTQYRPHRRVLTNVGSREKILYTARYDANGALELVEDGKENLYEYIQSHRDSVDIHVLLKRFQNGEKDVFERVQGFYGDISDIPDNFVDTLNAVMEAERIFNSLPADIRGKFNNNPREFVAAFGDPDKMLSVFGRDVLPSKPVEPDDVVKPDEARDVVKDTVVKEVPKQ